MLNSKMFCINLIFNGKYLFLPNINTFFFCSCMKILAVQSRITALLHYPIEQKGKKKSLILRLDLREEHNLANYSFEMTFTSEDQTELFV